MASKTVNDVILVITGPSGSGKTTLEKNLLACFPFLFYKLSQFTTREPRINEKQGDPYIFVTDKTFESIEDKLIGVVNSGTVFKKKYGSLPDFKSNKISTIILSEEGLIDLKTKVTDKTIVTIGLSIDIEDLPEEVILTRKDRIESFESEKKVLSLCDYVFSNRFGAYTKAMDVVDLLKEKGLIITE